MLKRHGITEADIRTRCNTPPVGGRRPRGLATSGCYGPRVVAAIAELVEERAGRSPRTQA